MIKAFTLIETMILLFIISIMLDLCINLLYYDKQISFRYPQIEESE